MMLVFSMTGSVVATEPIIDHFVTVSDEVFGPCPDGALIDAHLTFDITRWRFDDRLQFVIHGDHTFTKRTTGETFRSFADYHTVVYLDPDSDTGSSGAEDSGSFSKGIVVGGGLLSNQAGHIIYNPDGDIVGQVGVDDQHGFDLCAWMPL